MTEILVLASRQDTLPMPIQHWRSTNSNGPGATFESDRPRANGKTDDCVRAEDVRASIWLTWYLAPRGRKSLLRTTEKCENHYSEGIKVNNLSNTGRQALTVTHMLGIRYLLVEYMCIYLR
jgi:hypothetical protein